MDNQNLINALARLAEMVAKDEGTTSLEALQLAVLVFTESCGPVLNDLQGKLNVIHKATEDDLALGDLIVGISQMMKRLGDGCPEILRLVASLSNALDVLDRLTTDQSGSAGKN